MGVRTHTPHFQRWCMHVYMHFNKLSVFTSVTGILFLACSKRYPGLMGKLLAIVLSIS